MCSCAAQLHHRSRPTERPFASLPNAPKEKDKTIDSGFNLEHASGGDINLATCKHITSDETRLKEIEDRRKLDNLKRRAVDD